MFATFSGTTVGIFHFCLFKINFFTDEETADMLKNMFDLFQNGLNEILIYCPIKVHLTGEETTDLLRHMCGLRRVTCSRTVNTKSVSTVPLNLIFPGEEKTDPLKYVRPVPAKLYVRNLPLLSL
jgi:hypothetical protein